MCRPVYVSGKSYKAVFTSVVVLCVLFKPVCVRERPEKVVLTAVDRGAVKLMQTCLCDRKDLESSFHHCAVPVKPI